MGARDPKKVVRPARRPPSTKPAVAPKELLAAVGARDVKRLTTLLDQGGDPDAIWRGYRPLHATIQLEPHAQGEPLSDARRRCAELLLERGASPELHGAWPASRAAVLACLCGEAELLELLLARGARDDVFVDAGRGRTAALRKALARDKALVHARDRERAVEPNTPDATSAKRRARPKRSVPVPDETNGLTLLHIVASSRMGRSDAKVARALVECARVLLDAGADPNALVQSWSHAVDVAYFAVGARDAARLELLLERGADADRALASALWVDGTELSELALAHGARPDRTRMDGKPALNELVRWGRIEPALWLLEHGASPDVADERGWTALHQAVSRGNARMVGALLAAGADRERRDARGCDPGHLARILGREKIVALLEAREPAPARRRK